MNEYKLSYEAFSKKHIETYYSWRNNEEINIFDQPGFNGPIAYEIVEEWCEKVINQKDGYTFFLKDEVAGVYIGICALMHIDYKNSNSELSIVIGNREYWRKGVGTEVMNKLIDWGFNSLNLHKLYLHVFSSNTRAIGLYEKLGFKEEGRFREELYRNGGYQDVIRYGLLKEDIKK